MALYHAPMIVTDSLSLYLDAGNTKSYPGSGTVWYDLANRLSFVATGAVQTPFQTVGGAQAMSFNGTGYWECGTNFGLVDFGGECTLLLWIYMNNITTRYTIFEKAGNTYASYQQEIAVTMETSETASWYSRYDTGVVQYDSAASAALTIGQWSMLGIKMSTAKTTAPRSGFYSINGSAWVSNYTARSTTPVTPAGVIRVGSGYAGTMANCSVNKIIAYNKQLSDAEVALNYNILSAKVTG